MRPNARRASASGSRIDLGQQLASVGPPRQLTQLFAIGLNNEVVSARCLGRNRDHPACLIGGTYQRLAASGVKQEIARFARIHHHRPEATGQLHSQVTDSATGSGDGDPLARLKAPVHNQRLPSAQSGHRQRCRLNVVQGRRLGRENLGWHQGVLGGNAIAIERRNCEHLSARRNPVGVLGENTRQLIGRYGG